MLIRTIPLIICLVLCGCSSELPYPEAGPIYVAAFAQLGPEVEHFTIKVEKVRSGTTMQSLDLERVQEYGDFFFPEIGSHLTERDFPGLRPTLIDGNDLAALDTGNCEEFWQNFRSKYEPSTGFMQLSEVGFNKSRTQAIFYYSGSGGCLAGSGNLVLMELVDGRWVVAELENVWVA